MEISFEGIGQVAATFMVEGEVAPGHAVTVKANGTVGTGEEGDALCGVVLSVKEGMAAVQMGGLAKVAYTGDTAPAVGVSALVCDGRGGVMVAAEGGTDHATLWVDTTAAAAVIKL